MVYYKTSRRQFVKELRNIAQKNQRMYYQWVDLRAGNSVKQGIEIIEWLIHHMKEVIYTRNEYIVSGSLNIGFYPGKWVGYRLRTKEK